MLKALVKKQLLELNTWFFADKKTGKNRSKAGTAGFIILYAFLLFVMGGIFFGLSSILCKPLVKVGLDWFYGSIMCLIALTLGVFRSVFNTYATLYTAKDNDLLLSMPIPVRYILAVRLFGVWFWGAVFEAMVLIPALIVYYINTPFSFLSVFAGLITIISVSFLVLALSALLGFIVAKISTRIKHKSIITVLLSVAFIAGYYYLYSKAYSLLESIIANAVVLGEKVKGAAYPLYILGKGTTDSLPSSLSVLVCTTAIVLLVYFVLSKSFLRLSTARYVTSGKKRIKNETKTKSQTTALFFKELGRFTSSPTYMLNCSMGTLLTIVCAVFLIIKAEDIRAVLLTLEMLRIPSSLIICALLCMISAMNDITAPSVSLEGKSLWIVKSLPVTPEKALYAKLLLHFVITSVPMLILSVFALAVLKLGIIYSAFVLIIPQVFIFLNAEMGLIINLKMPNLYWTNEVVPIKQSGAVALSLYGGWIFIILLGVIYYFVSGFIGGNIYLCLVLLLLLSLSALCFSFIKTKGGKMFELL